MLWLLLQFRCCKSARICNILGEILGSTWTLSSRLLICWLFEPSYAKFLYFLLSRAQTGHLRLRVLSSSWWSLSWTSCFSLWRFLVVPLLELKSIEILLLLLLWHFRSSLLILLKTSFYILLQHFDEIRCSALYHDLSWLPIFSGPVNCANSMSGSCILLANEMACLKIAGYFLKSCSALAELE